MSVLDQDHTEVVVVISDNGSTDDTPAVCRELVALDPRITVHRQSTNLGLTGNYNWLMQTSLADPGRTCGFFMFLSDDDWLEPNYVSTCVARLLVSPDYSMMAGRTVLESESGATCRDGDVSLTSDSAAERLWDFCQDILPTGVFSGVMPLEIARTLPPQRNVVGHDWLLLASIIVLGKIGTAPDTAIHRGGGGESSSLEGLAETLGVSPLQVARPLATIAYFMVRECLGRSPVMGQLPTGRRLHLTVVVISGLFCRRAIPWLRHCERRRVMSTIAISALHGLRQTVLKHEPAPAPRAPGDPWRPPALEPVLTCPVCGCGERVTLHSGLPDQVFGIAGGRWHLYGCTACDAGFLDPRPASHALMSAYAGNYYTHSDLPPSPDLHDGMQGLRLKSRNAYVNKRYGYELEPASKPALLLAYARPRSRASHDRAFRHLRMPRRGARLLDVGCGSGEFVARARLLGWEAEGIDTDGAAVAAGRAFGLPLSTTPLEELAETIRGTVDVVTMSHVIEHVADPVGLLRAARTVLTRSGTLWLVTPNLDSRGHRRFCDRWMHLDPPRHLVLFGAKAIDLALHRAGFSMMTAPKSASGTIASFAQSWRIERGRSPLDESPVPPLVQLQGRIAGLRSLRNGSGAEELIRLARPSSDQ